MESAKDELDLKERIAKAVTMKKAIRALTILVGLGLIVFMTVANIVLDPTNVNWQDYLTNALVSAGIMIFGLIMGESTGEDRQLEKVGGLYQTNLGLYHIAREDIEPISIYFAQFFIWYKERKTYLKRLNHLIDNGFTYEWAKAILDYTSLEDLDKLTRQTILVKKGEKEIIVKRIDESKRAVVEEVLNGNVKINSYGHSFYLSASGDGRPMDELEEPRIIQADMRLNKRANRIIKIGSSLIISALWAMVTVKDYMDGNSAQAWLNLISRLTAFCTSFFSGWTTSVIDVKLQANLLSSKTSVLRAFKSSVDKGEWKPQSYEEEARAMYEKEEKERQEAEQAVVTPIVEPPSDIILLEKKD